MARKVATFNGEVGTEMATPIRIPRMPLDMSPESPEATEFYRKADAYIALMRMAKIVAYAKQCGIDPKELTGAGISLAAFLAIDAGIPGLQTIVDEKEKGTPGRPRTRNNADEMQFLLDMVELIKRTKWADTDKEACAIWAECESPKLSSKAHKADRDKRARTLANLVSKFRAAGNQSGGLPQFTTARQVEAGERLMVKFQELDGSLKLSA
jgi:hypothetical protein